MIRDAMQSQAGDAQTLSTGAPEAGVVYVPWFASPSQATVLAPDQEETGTCNLAFDQIAVGRPGPLVQYLDGFGTTVCEEGAAKILEHNTGLFTVSVCVMSNFSKSRVLALQLLTR